MRRGSETLTILKRLFQSTHSLRSATPVAAVFDIFPWFQSTHSLRSATAARRAFNVPDAVSIHALLAECDALLRPCLTFSHGFNPRTPCGVRRNIVHGKLSYTGFQSTHSLRSATLSGDSDSAVFKVSIHALLAECDKTTN